MEFRHEPVLLAETIGLLNIKPDGVYYDGTIGGAGHSLEIAKRLGENGRLIGTDRDEEAVSAAREKLSAYRKNCTVVHANFRDFLSVMETEKIPGADGILLDLGVSSHQFDDGDRGFSYRFDAPLDMRMDRGSELTAETIVNTYPEEKIKEILEVYGEERFAGSIARKIVKARAEKEIKTTFELVDIIRSAVPAKILRTGGHPAKQTFQALRIECNDELNILSETLGKAIDFLNPGGRIAVITFHSLEDRIVKNAFRNAENPCTCPKNFPVCVCGKKPKGSVVTRKPVTASQEELVRNHRAESAKLRVFEKTSETEKENG